MTLPGLLRQLVAAPIALDAVSPRTGPPHAHPLLTAQHSWTFPGRPPITLPNSAEQIAPLVELTNRPIIGLDTELHLKAWRTVLERPGVREILPAPELARLNEAGFFAADDANAADVDHILVGAVVSATTVKTDSVELTCEPLCGLIELVIVSSSGEPVSLWARGAWHRSTRDAMLDLERLAFLDPATTASTDRRRRGRQAIPKQAAGFRKVTVIVPDYALGSELAAFRAALTRTGKLLGFDINVEAIDPWNKPSRAAIEHHLSRNPPMTLLLALGAGEAAPLRDAYQQATAYGLVFDDLEIDDPDRLLDDVRSRLCQLANVGASLMQIKPSAGQIRRELAGRPPIQTMAPFPFDRTRATARKTRGIYGEYLRDPTTGNWWSRDIDKHGAHVTDEYGRAQFKLFSHGSRGLTLTGSTDVHGKLFDKHESVEFIPWHEFGS